MDEKKDHEIKTDTADFQMQETPVQRQKREILLREHTPEALWEAILAFEGAVFYTAKGLEYSYMIRGNEMFVSRKEKSVTRASILVAYKKALGLGCVTGPKQLGVFGASYLYPVFRRLGIICASVG